MKTKNTIKIYSPKGTVELIENKNAKVPTNKGLSAFIQYLHYRHSPNGSYQIFAPDLKSLQKKYFANYGLIEAAGGVVFNNKKEILLIHRRGFWDLPKGKIDPGETKKQAALREVMEETGIKNLLLEKPLKLYYNGSKTTYHTYRYKRRQTIKPSHWYIMKTHKQELIPQTNEDINQAIWVSTKDISKYMGEMYPAIRDIIKSVV